MIFTAKNTNSYLSFDSPIKVLSLSGRVVFYRPNRKKKAIVFNLPEGQVCKTTNDISVVSRKKQRIPTFEELFRAYPPQYNFPLPKKGQLKVVRGKNPNKATIYPEKHYILIDKKLFSSAPLPSVKFILFHELGHYFYNDEELADLFATVCMLKKGFNLYDCLITQLKYFGRTKANADRTLFIFKKLSQL